MTTLVTHQVSGLLHRPKRKKESVRKSRTWKIEFAYQTGVQKTRLKKHYYEKHCFLLSSLYLERLVASYKLQPNYSYND